MSYHFAKPSWPLSMLVKQYWGLENCIPNGGEHIQRIVPSGLTELTFYFDGNPTVTGNNKSLNEKSILCGHLKSYYDISVKGHLSMFSVQFLPFAFRLLLKIPANEFYNSNIPLGEIASDITNRLEDAMFEAHTFEDRVVIIEKFLMKLLCYDHKTFELKRINNSLRLIRNAKGLIRIDSLSEAACLSRKQFERVFAEYIGTSPKHFLKTVRFQGSLNLKHLNPSLSLTELAYNSGYFDQAHMINDYKFFSGLTPGAYFKECEPFSDFFSE